MKQRLALLVVLAISIPCFSVAIGNYDSLDELIARSDVVAIVRFSEPSPTTIVNDGWKEYTGNVYQVLKGRIPIKHRVFKGRVPSHGTTMIDSRVKLWLVDTTTKLTRRRKRSEERAEL